MSLYPGRRGTGRGTKRSHLSGLKHSKTDFHTYMLRFGGIHKYQSSAATVFSVLQQRHCVRTSVVSFNQWTGKKTLRSMLNFFKIQNYITQLKRTLSNQNEASLTELHPGGFYICHISHICTINLYISHMK